MDSNENGPRITPEWCIAMAKLEGNAEIGAGALDHPLRTRCEVPPQGWWCSREPGHDGPCAARPSMEPDVERAAVRRVLQQRKQGQG